MCQAEGPVGVGVASGMVVGPLWPAICRGGPWRHAVAHFRHGDRHMSTQTETLAKRTTIPIICRCRGTGGHRAQ
eukprot:2614965-Alexandrium_andersonii.AAC.1